MQVSARSSADIGSFTKSNSLSKLALVWIADLYATQTLLCMQSLQEGLIIEPPLV